MGARAARGRGNSNSKRLHVDSSIEREVAATMPAKQQVPRQLAWRLALFYCLLLRSEAEEGASPVANVVCEVQGQATIRPMGESWNITLMSSVQP